MAVRPRELRRLFIGKEVGVIFALLLAGSFLASDSAFVEFAVLLASAVGNVYGIWFRGSFPWYLDLVAFFFIYVEAVAVTALSRGVRTGYQKYRNSETNG